MREESASAGSSPAASSWLTSIAGPHDLADGAERARHQLVEIERLGSRRGPAAEGEEVAGEDGRPVGGLLDLGQVLAGLGGERRLVQQQADVPQDPGEQVVEVVGDPARELGDLAGAVELHQPLLQCAPVGDVGGAPAVAEELARRDRGSAPPG